MLIQVSSPPEDFPNTPQTEDFFHELIRSSYKGLHYIAISRRACNWALTNLDLNRKQSEHLKFLKARYTQDANLKSRLPTSLTITFDDQPLTKDNDHFCLGITNAINFDLLSEPVFLVENSGNDGQLYQNILDTIKSNFPIKHFCFQTKNGGGSDTPKRLKDELDASRIVVCLCDSDKYSPHSRLSSINRRVKAVVNSFDNFIGKTYETIGKSAENHIPIDIILNHSLCPHYTQNKFNKIQSLLDAQPQPTQQNDCMWLYLNLKDGFNLATVLERDNSEETRQWLSQKHQINLDELEELSFEGFGKNLLPNFLNNPEALGSFHRFTRTNYWEMNFSDFFYNLFSFFVSDRKKSTLR